MEGQGDFEGAHVLATSALDCFSEKGEPRGELSAFRALVGQAAFALGDDAEALEWFQRLASGSEKVFPYGPIYADLGLGELKRQVGDEEAILHYEAAGRRCRDLGGRVEYGYSLLGLAEAARDSGEAIHAASRAIEAEQIGEVTGHPWLRLYATLVRAACDIEGRGGECLSTADRVNGLFRRRTSDRNLERVAIGEVGRCMSEGVPMPAFRFNYL